MQLNTIRFVKFSGKFDKTKMLMDQQCFDDFGFSSTSHKTPSPAHVPYVFNALVIDKFTCLNAAQN